ncbi:MAG: DUF4097 family beta strand repeat-containing protein [Proteobacteria bacterium]|nr:DUF4097 family beta strand repeat-containing protein [Pseudomonadota bacterium]
MRTRGHGLRHEGGRLGGFLRSLMSGVPWTDRAEHEAELRLEAPPSRVLRVHNANGRTRVHGEDRDDLFIEVVKCARAESREQAEDLLDTIRVQTRVTGGDLEIDIEAPKKWNRLAHANLELHVPRDLQVSVAASNGKVCMGGLRGAVQARSSNGSVNVTDVVGDVEVSTSNAPVSCKCTSGTLIARSSNGKIALGDHRGSIDASTSNGLIHAHVDQLGEAGCLLATSNGRIVLELPDEVDAEVDLRVDNGFIRSDRELEGSPREANGRLRGRIGRGGALIKLRTSNGSISLR